MDKLYVIEAFIKVVDAGSLRRIQLIQLLLMSSRRK